VVICSLGFLMEFAVLTYSDDDEACESGVLFLPSFLGLAFPSDRPRLARLPQSPTALTDRRKDQNGNVVVFDLKTRLTHPTRESQPEQFPRRKNSADR
jgi:hypothetical protein